MKNQFKKLIFITAGFALILSSIPQTVFGMSDAARQTFYAENDIPIYYDPSREAVICGQSGEGSTSVFGGSNIEKIWNWLTNAGLSDNQAAGVMGNIAIESSYSPTRQEDSKSWPAGGWGLAQWTFGRRDNIKKALPENIKHLYSNEYGGAPGKDGKHPKLSQEDYDALIGFQLNYLMTESKGRVVSRSVANQGYGTAGDSEWETLKKQTSIEDATVFWHNNFEVSAQSAEAVLRTRLKHAQDAYNAYGSGGTGGSTSECGGSQNLSEPATAILAKITEYAWPYSVIGKGKSLNSDATPKYQSAAGKHFRSGYGPNAYADCTYFVATVMRDSGVDPTFPAGTTTISKYLQDNNNTKFEIIKNPSFDKLEPGDIIQHTQGGSSAQGSWSGHIMFYTGLIEGEDGKEYYGADASKYTRVPGLLPKSSVESMFTKSSVVIARPL